MSPSQKTRKAYSPNIIVISDTHSGCGLALCPPKVRLIDKGTYQASTFQRKLWDRWGEFRKEWIPRVTRKQPFILVHNGDAVDGRHHGTTSQVSHNLEDQAQIGYEVLAPLVEQAEAYYHIRGTEAHVGPSGEAEESLARRLGAISDDQGNSARWELWLDLYGHLCHFSHHIGVTGSSSYEATAVGKEMVENYVESGRWGERAAQVTVRSHRHRYGKWEQYGHKGLQISLVTPAWQMKTGYVFRGQGKMTQPQLGGALIRVGDEELHTRAMVWAMSRPKTVEYVR